ncbi:MAG: hypothetical protein RMY34_30335 [Aulosira sp. DedQUE10]|nr:hypothetical protein [Aulosira sp. DedQUE10]
MVDRFSNNFGLGNFLIKNPKSVLESLLRRETLLATPVVSPLALAPLGEGETLRVACFPYGVQAGEPVQRTGSTFRKI